MKNKMHTLKTWPLYFQQIIDGEKTFEFRMNDRGFKNNDELLLLEYNPDNKKYSGRQCIASVTSILFGGFGLPEGYCIMSIKVKHGASTPLSGITISGANSIENTQKK